VALVAGLAAWTAPAGAGPVAEGHLDWGVKASFRSYITGPIAHGSATPAAGAGANGDGTFRFPSAPGGTRDGATAAVVPLAGSVRFTGHEGQLDLTISDLVVTISGTTGTLRADVSSRSLGDEGAQQHDDIPFAVLPDVPAGTVSGSTTTWTGVPAQLTAQGAEAFAGFYAEGTGLDPLTIAVTEGEATTTTTVPDGSGSTTSTSTSTTAPASSSSSTSTTVAGAPSTATTAAGPATLSASSVAAGGSLTVSGSGFRSGEQVQAFLHSDPVFLAVGSADAQGAVRLQVTIPATTPVGTHQVELRGVTGGRSLMSGPLTVTAATGGLPRTGTGALDLLPWALLLVGLGVVVLGRSRRARSVPGR
jgi:hypothetical protein